MLFFHCLYLEWCTVYCPEDQMIHAKSLETEACEFITDEDLLEGRELIWRYKGAPYTVEVVKVHGKYNYIATNFYCDKKYIILTIIIINPISDEKPIKGTSSPKIRYLEDSDDSDLSDIS